MEQGLTWFEVELASVELAGWYRTLIQCKQPGTCTDMATLYLGAHQPLGGKLKQWVPSCTPDLLHPPATLGCVCLPELLRGTVSVDLAILSHIKYRIL